MKKQQHQLIKAMFFLILAFLLIACSREEPTPTPVPEEPAPEVAVEPTAAPEEAQPVDEIAEISQPIYRWGEVADRLWVLVGYGDAANPTVVEEGTKITATFSSVEPTVSGSGGCNNYFASYESTDDGSVTISGPIGATMMACESGMETEAAYLAALETVATWGLTEEGRLELTYDTGQPYEEKLVFALGEVPLTGTTWRLVSWGDPDEPTAVEEGTSVTAVFNPETDTTGTVGGNATCNNYSTSYTLDGSSISFGPVAGTMMMCPVGADQEAAYLAALDSAQTFEIAGSNLFITYDSGTLHFSSQNLPLTNVLWQAVMVAGEPVPEEVEITALFEPGDETDAGTAGGSTGCNNYNTSYETSQDLSTNPTTNFLTISSPMAMTMAICPDETLAQFEQSYLGALETAETYEIFGDQLVISSPNGEIQFAANREPLEGTLWRLVSMGDAENPQSPIEEAHFTAQFNRLPTLPSGTVVGETGCNEYNATFTANVSELKVNLPATTRQACGDAFAEQEQQFFLGLNAATEYRILGNTLQIPYGENGEMVLNFEATLPDIGEGVDLTPLADTFWYLLSIGDNPLISYTEITAEFEVDESGLTGTVSGSSGCNAYNGGVSTESGAFVVGPLANTAKACANDVMEQEGGYLDWLSQAYAYDRVGDQLLISTANGVLTYNSTPVLDQSAELQNRTWYLVSVGNLTAVPGGNATTLFSNDGSSISGNTGCNEFNGAYATEPGNLLTISGVSSTRAACASEDLTRQEEALLAFLPSAVSYVVVGNQMQIQTTDGSVINYTDIPPAAPAPPTAVIVAENLGETGQLLTFDGSQSTPGDLPILSYQWEMDDGTVLSGPTVVYSFDTPGTYNISLTVTDRAGQSNTATKSIQISPVVDVVPPTAVIDGPVTATVGEPVAFSAASSQQGTAAIATYQWQSGDGNGTPPALDTGFTTIYAQPGVYYPSVTVADAAGLSDTAVMEITVSASLGSVDWILSNTIPGTTISLNFANGSLSGFGGCNSYNGTYRVPGNSNNVQVDPLTSTGALCSEEIMNQEQGYFTALQSASSFAINGNALTLTTASGPLTFYAAVAAPAPLPAVGP
jgi:heat shock protein HslJ